MVKKTELDTKIWFALKGHDDSLVIFDAFYDNVGRDKHFAGQVAQALKNNAEKLVLGGWENGVLKNVTNSKILSSKLPKKSITVSIANYITFKANQGKEAELVALLSNVAELVNKTEPKTIYWITLQLGNNNFAIFDAFSDEEGQKIHVNGNVAMTIKKHADTLIQDGWAKGVLSHVQNFKVLTNV